MRRRLALVAAGGLLTVLAAPALANPVPPPPVGVYQDGHGSVCFFISLQTPTCTPSVTH